MEDLLELLKLGCNIKLDQYGLNIEFLDRGGIIGKTTTLYISNASIEDFNNIQDLIGYVKGELDSMDNLMKYFNSVPERASEV